MKKLRIYLDTSVISFLFADDAPEKRDATREFFDARLDRFSVAISDLVLVEIGRTRNAERRERLMRAIDRYGLLPVEVDDGDANEIDRLATLYVTRGVIPPAKRDDAVHEAICTVLEFDLLLSWNFAHLANVQKQIKINALNQDQGYLKPLLLTTPLEVMNDEAEFD